MSLARLARPLAAATALLAAPPVLALSPNLLVPSALPYNVYRGGSLLGEGLISLKPAGTPDCWFFSQEASPKSWLKLLSGDVLEQSNFCVQDGKIRPVAYRYSRDGVGSGKENFSLRFDWPKQQAIYQNGDVRPITEGTLDRLSIQLALRDWLLSERSATGKEPVGEHEVKFADRKKVDSYRFEVRAHERVTVPAGTFDTTRLDRTDSKTRRTQFWLSPEHGYIVIKAEQQRDDDPVVKLMLNKLPPELLPAAAASALPKPD
ncbi:MAG: hypothetical protein JWQ90_237 [Hydrocarboniphaga sp.]|uniref:DUF3108 domain-containing protein n=1 Tax=Hydrocarboniphaga sp. TaxID=2033016 RepID=UPI0026055B6B|nr:DUF3108 domain-containing protein [Hydrocarboniphaga sp.]MDB5967787.1 hypothetical protein [Hydrocarboniphaga sp.]